MDKINNLKFYIDNLIDNGLQVEVIGNKDAMITSITFDSKKVTHGTLFVCKGAHFKPEYLQEAIDRGAVAYISEKRYEENSVPCIITQDIRKAMSVLAYSFYGDLSNKLKMIGITGTKGKSTTAFFMRYILNDYLLDTGENEAAICSGISNYDGVINEESKLTTPENLVLFEHMNNAVESGIKYMVMEVSSQALKYNRVDGITYEVSCFNNISEDHISPNEHKDFDDYFSSKLRIFKQSKMACINLDSDYISEIKLASSSLPTVTFSLNIDANITAKNIKSVDGRVSFDVIGKKLENYPNFDEKIELAAFGKINVINALSAIAISVSLDIPIKYIKSGLSKAVTPGRMQVFRSKDGKKIALVDYAHNKMSYELLLKSISEEFPGRDIIMSFGCVGGKAFNRRKEVGEIAGKYCKHVILTEVDPAEEKVIDICNEIAKNLGDRCTYEIIEDRPTAIAKLASMANEDNIVIAAGKALESFQKRGSYLAKIEPDVSIMMKEMANK